MAALLNAETIPLIGMPGRHRPLRGAGTRSPSSSVRQVPARPIERPRYAGFEPFAPRNPSPLRLVRTNDVERATRRGASAIWTGLGTVAALLALWFGAGALRSADNPGLAVLPGTVHTAHGYLYRVQPGDTLWSIATRLQPSGDPRPIVDQLDAELHGATLVPGERLLVP